MIYPKLIVNKKNWNYLYHLWHTEKLPHALLFHGPEGSGKEGHAIELAALLNCLSPHDNFPCGTCSSCKQTKTFQHGNVKLIVPLPRGKITSKDDPVMKAFSTSTLQDYLNILKKKAEDPYLPILIPSANTILINSIRELKHDVSLSNLDNGWRIILIFQAEKLCIPNPDAAHALLKLLEEPPDRTVFFLVSSHSNAILDTIHSRCQNLYFPTISSQWIEKQFIIDGTDPDKASVIARISGGNICLSKVLINNFTDLMDQLNILLKAFFSNDPNNWQYGIDVTNQLKNKGQDKLHHLFRCMLLFFRDLLYYNSTGVDDGLVYIDQFSKIDNLCKSYPNADWEQCIHHINNTHNNIIRNGFVPLMILTLIIDIQKSIKGNFHQSFCIENRITA